MRILVLGNPSRVGKTAGRYTLANLCLRDSLVVTGRKTIEHPFAVRFEFCRLCTSVQLDLVFAYFKIPPFHDFVWIVSVIFVVKFEYCSPFFSRDDTKV